MSKLISLSLNRDEQEILIQAAKIESVYWCKLRNDLF